MCWRGMTEGLRCFDVATGERVGKTIRLLKKGSDAAKIRVVPAPNREEVMVSVEGDLRIQRWNVRIGEDLTQGMLHERDVFWFGCLTDGEIGISIDNLSKIGASQSSGSGHFALEMNWCRLFIFLTKFSGSRSKGKAK